MGNVVPIIQSHRVETKQGEVLLTINLNLNVKMDAEGKLFLEAHTENTPTCKKDGEQEVLPKALKFEKPDILDNSEIINFGKEIK